MRHNPIAEAGGRREARELYELENDFALAVGFDAAERAIGKVQRPGSGKQSLRPELDFIGCEMHGEVSHGVPYGMGLGRFQSRRSSR